MARECDRAAPENCEASCEKAAALCRSILGELRPLSYAPPALGAELRNRHGPLPGISPDLS